MLKKFVYVFIAFVIAIAIGVFFGMRNGGEHQEKASSNQTQSSEKELSQKIKPSQKPQGASSQKTQVKVNPATLVSTIFSESAQGRIPHVPFTAGQTKIQTVKQMWSGTEQTTNTEEGSYVDYPNHKAAIGYQHQLIFDVRSFDPSLQKIHLADIKKIKGEPDEIHYYKDKTSDQIILVYSVNAAYDLKWVLPKPTNREPNPSVDHVSVVANVNHVEDGHSHNVVKVSDMSLDEKIGQMIFAGTSDTSLSTNTKNLINQYHIGGMIFYSNNFVSPQQSIQLLDEIKLANAHNRLPLMLGVDQEGGKVFRLPGLIHTPTNARLGAINDPQLSYKIGTLLGEELNAFGLNLDFAPVLDVNSNPNNPVIGDRSFGNNANIVSQLGTKTMEGIQSQHIISVVKHFPGHGDTSVDSHLNLPKVNKNLADLKKLELIPFEQAIHNGADVVMVAHILLPQLDATYPSSMSKYIMTDILRRQLGFQGVIMTDDMTMKAITNYFTIGKAAVKSVQAGSDIILVAHDYNEIVATIQALKTAVENGEIPEARIDQSVNRIIQLKRKYHISDRQVQDVNVGRLNQYGEQILK